MKAPGESPTGYAVQFSDEAIRFIVYFTLASAVPAFGAIVAGFKDENAVVIVGALVVMVAVDIGMMFIVRQRERQRRQLDREKATHVSQPDFTVAKVLGGTGIVLSSVGSYLDLSDVTGSWVSGIIGLIGVALVLTAGYQARRSMQSPSVREDVQ